MLPATLDALDAWLERVKHRGLSPLHPCEAQLPSSYPTPLTCSSLYTRRLSSSMSCMPTSFTMNGRRSAAYACALRSGKPSLCQLSRTSHSGHFSTGSS